MIEPSKSPWNSPVMIVKQKTREGKTKFRFISDNRGLNDVTIKDSFPLSRMDAAFDCMGVQCTSPLLTWQEATIKLNG